MIILLLESKFVGNILGNYAVGNEFDWKRNFMENNILLET